jgi:TP901 family phage tail tape measure protein
MATNLEYIYKLKDQYSKRLKVIVKAQTAFSMAYTKSMGKVNSSLANSTRLLEKNTAAVKNNALAWKNTRLETGKYVNSLYSATNAYSTNRAAMSRMNTELGSLVGKQNKYADAVRRTTAASMMSVGRTGRTGPPIPRKMSKTRGITSDRLGALTAGTGGGFFLKGALDKAVDFQTNINAIRAILPSLDKDLVESKALEWGDKTIFSAVEVASGMREMIQANPDQANMLKEMPAVIELATAGQIGLAEAVKLSTDVVNQFGRAFDVREISDFLARGARSTSTVADLGRALQRVGTTASAAGISLQDTLAVLMNIGETSLRGEEAGTKFMNFIRGTQKMAEEGKLQKSLGRFFTGTGYDLSDVFNIKTGQFKDIQLFMRLMTMAEDSAITDVSKNYLAQAAKVITAMSKTDLGNISRFNEIIADRDITVWKMAKEILDGLPGSAKRLESAWSNVQIAMIKTLTWLPDVINNLADFLVELRNNHPDVIKWTTLLIGATVALTAVGFALWASIGALGAWKVALLATGSMLKLMFYIPLGVVAGLTYAWEVAMWALNASMWANPITWISAAVIALIAIFAAMVYKTSSLTNAFKVMGGIIMSALFLPITLVEEGLRGILYLLAKLPKGMGGGSFQSMYETVTQANINNRKFRSGSDSWTPVGVGMDVWKYGDAGNDWTAPKTADVGRQSTAGLSKNGTSNGKADITIRAEKGTQVVESSHFGDLGMNILDGIDMGYYN